MSATSAAPVALRRPPADVAGPVPAESPRWRARPEFIAAAWRLVAFAALASWAAVAWAGLLASPPAGRVAIVLAVGVCTAAALLAVGRRGLPAPAAWVAALGIVLVAVAAGGVATGIPARLLAPGRWHELASQVSAGIGNLGNATYPYGGSSDWSRIVILSAMPAWIGLSAALAFWPARGGTPRWSRLAALVLLVAAFGVGVTVSAAGTPLLRGAVLAVLVAAWLWVPAPDPRRALAAGALVLSAALISLPIAARFDGHHPWLDYRNWDWSWASGDSGESFNWDHSYGPLNWQRTGEVLLQARSDAPHYWRTAVLDQFDGYRWHESTTSGNGAVELPLPASRNSFPNEVLPLRESWIHQVTFTISGLRSQLLVGAGAVLSVHGLSGVGVEGLTGVAPTTSGLLLPSNSPLGAGDSYTVRAYIPDPTAAEMRASPARYPRALAPYRLVSYPSTRRIPPAPGVPVQNANGPDVATIHQVNVPAWGAHAELPALAHSAYGRIYALAQRIVAGAHTPYGAVQRIEQYLRANFAYRENVPQRDYPLRAFLFADKAGYCQQFSGAMALMLRMVGIPTRVASGFSPGTPDNGSYVVRDFDAHSWVEVYFNRIGWVSFDPTPGAAPAQSRITGLGVRSLNAPPTGKAQNEQIVGSLRRTRLPVTEPAGSGSSAPWGALLAAGLLIAASAGGALGLRALRARSLSPAAAVEAQLRELVAALARLRSWQPHGTTLLGLERRLGVLVGPESAGYAARLRRSRYSRSDAQPATPAERRAMRRELSSGAGLRARLAALLAIPPGGALRR
jgi:protein-glutamine gamma-glutamyltransferase